MVPLIRLDPDPVHTCMYGEQAARLPAPQSRLQSPDPRETMIYDEQEPVGSVIYVADDGDGLSGAFQDSDTVRYPFPALKFGHSLFARTSRQPAKVPPTH